jgi:hypothetical protein
MPENCPQPPARTQPAARGSSLRKDKESLRSRLRRSGVDNRQIAAELALAFGLRPRTAWRETYGWSLTEAASRINLYRSGVGIDPAGSAGMTSAHLSEHETWPGYGAKASGRRPSLQLLAVLASVYQCELPDLIDAADRAHLPAADLLVIDCLPATSPIPSLAPGAAFHDSTPRLRLALNSFDAPGDGAIRSLGDLAAAVRRLTGHRLEARYHEMGQELPDVIAELSRAVHQATGQEQARSARLLALAYRAADGMAYKLGYLDLSARIIDRMCSSACLAQDPALLATCAYVRTETFFATGDLEAATRSLIKAADDMAAAGITSQTDMAAYGALHMRAAVVAGREGKRDAAWDHLGEARRVARDVPEGVYVGTAFGPSSVRVHHLAVAVELKDNPAAIEQAAAWSPPRSLTAERRSHYFIDLAVAQADIGFHHDACQSLQTARQIAPQHAHDHPRVRNTLQALLHDHRSRGTAILELAAWAGVS